MYAHTHRRQAHITSHTYIPHTHTEEGRERDAGGDTDIEMKPKIHTHTNTGVHTHRQADMYHTLYRNIHCHIYTYIQVYTMQPYKCKHKYTHWNMPTGTQCELALKEITLTGLCAISF